MKSKIQFVACLLVGLLFINAGLNKFLQYMPVPKDLPEKMINAMKAFMEIGWLMPLVGLVEIIAGLLFIVPKTRPLGAIMLVPILAGILLTHITAAPSGLPVALVVTAVIAWVVIDNRQKYLPMIGE